MIFQMNSALTKTDTSLWLMKWIPLSLNWLDINSLITAPFPEKFIFEVINYPMILPKNITINNSVNKSMHITINYYC